MSGPAPDDDPRRGAAVLGVLRRFRALIVLVPLLVGLAIAGAIGAQMLWAEPPDRSVPPDVTCWDRSTAPETECPEPSGVEGLRWVYPSFTPNRGDCGEIPGEGPLQWRCRERLDGEPVLITYSVRPSVDQALTFLESRYGEPREVAAGERLVFRGDERTDGGYVLAVAYARHPLVVTVTAPTIGVRDRALTQLVRFRPDSQVRVRPTPG